VTSANNEPSSNHAKDAQDVIVELRAVHFGYGQRPILTDVSLTVPRGKVVALMGASGGGKTTILRLIGGLWKAQRGDVLFEGAEVSRFSSAELYAARRRMGVLFQFGALFPDLTVGENVAFPLREHTNLSEAMLRDLVMMKLNAVGLRGARDLKPSQISGGMARRVALARAIALDPDLMMYDEPFAGLDPVSLGIIAKLIREINDALGITSLIVSHDLHETFAIADLVYILADGAIVASGSPKEIEANENPLVRQFIKGLPDGPLKFHYPAKSLSEDFA
jgi:phospholipid/cholesterol/gamma-HCH transport system ATP-binding protein